MGNEQAWSHTLKQFKIPVYFLVQYDTIVFKESYSAIIFCLIWQIERKPSHFIILYIIYLQGVFA